MWFKKKFKQLFIVSNVYDLLWPLLQISKIFALLPLRLRNKRSNHIYVTYNIFIIIVFVSADVYVLHSLDYTSNNIADVALRIELYLCMIMITIMNTMVILRKRLFMQILKDIVTLDCEFNLCSITFDYNMGLKLVLSQIIGITCVFLSKFGIQFNLSKDINFYAYTIFNLTDYINTLMLFQYVDILLILRLRYVRLNRLIDGKEMRLLKKWQLETYRIKLIAKLHYRLHEICANVNQMYGVQILITICVRFIMITMQLIIIYKSIQQDYVEDANVIYYILSGIYLFLHISKLLMIVAVSENVVYNAKQIADSLYKKWLISNVQHNEEVII